MAMAVERSMEASKPAGVEAFAEPFMEGSVEGFVEASRPSNASRGTRLSSAKKKSPSGAIESPQTMA